MTSEFDRIMAKVQKKSDQEAMLEILPATVEKLLEAGEVLAHAVEVLGTEVVAITKTLAIHQAQLERVTERLEALEREVLPERLDTLEARVASLERA